MTLKIIKAIKFVVNKKIGKWKRWGSEKTWENEKANKRVFKWSNKDKMKWKIMGK